MPNMSVQNGEAAAWPLLSALDIAEPRLSSPSLFELSQEPVSRILHRVCDL